MEKIGYCILLYEYFLCVHSTINITEMIAYLLTYCPLCLLAHRAATKVFHSFRSWASLWIVSHVWFRSLISPSTVLRQVVLGRPLFLLPSGVQWRAVRVMSSLSFLITCPIHLHLLLVMMLSMLSWWHWAYSASFEMVFGQKMRHILLRLFVWKTDSLLRSFLVILQHSEPYRRVEKDHSSGTKWNEMKWLQFGLIKFGERVLQI